MKFETDWLDTRWIFDVEIFMHQHICVAKEHGLLVGIERKFVPFGIGVEFG